MASRIWYQDYHPLVGYVFRSVAIDFSLYTPGYGDERMFSTFGELESYAEKRGETLESVSGYQEASQLLNRAAEIQSAARRPSEFEAPAIIAGPVAVGIPALIKVLAAVFGAILPFLRSGMTRAVKRAFEAVVRVLEIGVDGVLRFAWSIARAVRRALELFGDLMSKVIPRVLEWVDRILAKIQRIQERILGPITRIIETYRRTLLRLYELYLRPVLDALTKIRKAVALLRLARVPAARKLDQRLLRLEAKFIHPILVALQKTNEVIALLNAIVTARGILQHDALMESLAVYTPSWLNIWYNAQLGILSPELQALLAGRVSDSELAAAIDRAKRRFEQDVAPGSPAAGRANQLFAKLIADSDLQSGVIITP